MTTPCRADSGADPDTWFTRATEPDAKRICATCPALDACRRAIDTIEEDGHLEHGVWAAETPTERTQRRNQTTTSRKRRGRATLTRTPPSCRYCGRPFRRWSETAADRPGTVKHHGHGTCESCAGRLRRGTLTPTHLGA